MNNNKKVIGLVLVIVLVLALFVKLITYKRLDDKYVYADIKKVILDMSEEDMLKILPEDSYTYCYDAGYYVNDLNTGHVFHISMYSGLENRVKTVTDTGIDVNYIAQEEKLDLLKSGMYLDEVVNILGRPVGEVVRNSWLMIWRVRDYDTVVVMPFGTDVDGKSLYTGTIHWSEPKPFDRNDKNTWYDFLGNNKVKESAVSQIEIGMTLEEVVNIIGKPKWDAGYFYSTIVCEMMWNMEDGKTLLINFKVSGLDEKPKWRAQSVNITSYE